jgi:transposase-like protein
MRIRLEVGRHARETNEQLEDFVAFLLDDGTSLRVIAEQLGVGPTTVRNWADAARRRQ